MPTTIPEPDVLLVLDNDLGDVELADVDADDRGEALLALLLLVAAIVRRIERERSEQRRRELYEKFAAWLERGQ